MAKKTFALELNGLEIKTLEDLQKNFNLEQVVNYFKSGELLDWLADRFYDDEADAIENISADDKNLSQKICAALGVECDEDIEFTQRIRAKKKILMELTDDENIINNATTTALNQDDLANLLHMDYSTIYLCGENFTVPIRIQNKKYIGVLSTPKIKIKANSDEELAEKNIYFENCILPFQNKKNQIDMIKNIFNANFPSNIEKFLFLRRGWGSNQQKNNITDDLKNFCIKMVCQDKYKENEIIHMEIDDNCTHGWALTYDSFCCGGIAGKIIIKYKNIFSAGEDIQANDAFKIQYSKNGEKITRDDFIKNMFDEKFLKNIGDFVIDGDELNSNLTYYKEELGKFLMTVKNIVDD